MDTTTSHYHNLSHGNIYEPRVHSHSAKHEVALAACKNIPGAEQAINKHFYRGLVNIPFQFPIRENHTQKFHHTTNGTVNHY